MQFNGKAKQLRRMIFHFLFYSVCFFYFSAFIALHMCVFSLAFAGQVQLMPSKIEHMQVRQLEQQTTQEGRARGSVYLMGSSTAGQAIDVAMCCVMNEKWLSTSCIYNVYATLNFNGQRREVCYAKLQFTCVNLIKLPTGNVAAILMNIPHLIPPPPPFIVSLKYTTAVSHSSSQLLLLLPLVAQAST